MPIAVFELMSFPPVEFFRHWVQGEDVCIEAHEHYNKRSYRNRYDIPGPNGILSLVIPLKKGKNKQMPIRDVQISFDVSWPDKHRQAIRSAYGRAPYYEEYNDVINGLFEDISPYLFEFNLKVLKTICKLLGIPDDIAFTPYFIRDSDDHFLNMKDRIGPKNRNSSDIPPYEQVFTDRFGFIPGLSILDVLFNLGPEVHLYLKSGV